MCKLLSLLLQVFLLASVNPSSLAFVIPSLLSPSLSSSVQHTYNNILDKRAHRKTVSCLQHAQQQCLQPDYNNNNILTSKTIKPKNWVASAVLATTVAVSAAFSSSTVLPAQAYVPSDYASETVQETVKALKDAAGNIDATFQAYENIASIISEGKGVGGMVNYQGIQLERGFVADEDTSIYNPGLTLLTESEKERLVEALIDNRKSGLNTGQWNENNEAAFFELKERLDPFHLQELSGYLKIVPFYGAALYLAVLAVQQNARGLFQVAYLVGVVAFFGPIVALIAAGV